MILMSEIIALDDLNFFEVLATTHGVVLVFFTAPSCGACRQLKLVLSKMIAENATFQVFEVDAVHNGGLVNALEVDAVHNGGLVNALEVFHLPAMFLYVNGRYHRAIHCEALPQRIQQAIDIALLLPAEEEP